MGRVALIRRWTRATAPPLAILPGMAEIRIKTERPETYRVEVIEPGSQSSHQVTLRSVDLARYAPSVEPETLLRASFEFLLEREPKESILGSFDLPVIERYFSEYPREIRKRLR